MKIIMYTTTTCPYCKMEKAFFKEKGVDYEEKIVDQDDAALAEMQKVSDGHLGVPFTVITKDDGSMEKVVGFDQGRFEKILSVG